MAEDIISKPNHYCFGKYEPMSVIMDWGLDFALGNVVKYIARAGKKANNPRIQDLLKAKEYLDREIEYITNGNYIDKDALIADLEKENKHLKARIYGIEEI